MDPSSWLHRLALSSLLEQSSAVYHRRQIPYECLVAGTLEPHPPQWAAIALAYCCWLYPDCGKSPRREPPSPWLPYGSHVCTRTFTPWFPLLELTLDSAVPVFW